MFEHHPHPIAVRSFMVAVYLALLVGCLPRTTNPAAPVPANLVATAGDALVTLTWTASTGATGYNVKRATINGGPYTQLAAPTSPGYKDSSVTDGVTYYYVVSALNTAGESANSVQVSATPEAPKVPPPAPINLAATPGDSVVTLTWTASSGATSYYVKRSTTSGGPYTKIAAPTTTSYTDTSLTNGTTYYYVVSAINSVGESANSAQVGGVPSPPPPKTFGTWINVTPSGVNLTGSTLPCGTLAIENDGTQTIQADSANPANLYVQFTCQGIWKSTDYGATWTGPINTGTNGAAVGDCSGGIAISPGSAASVPTIYEACIRGSGIGFWKSLDGGVNWANYVVTPTARQDYYPPVFDPDDENHLLLAAHEFDSIVESVDGGQNWTSVPLANGMLQDGGTGFIFFVNTGNASTTRGNWLWIAQQSGGKFGTWRTTNGGAAWVRVDKNEHPIGASQIYQPGNDGVVYMAGAYSALGWGVLRSKDYGETWAHVGMTNNETVVLGTSKNVYSMYGYPAGPGSSYDTFFEIASQPGTGVWVAPGTPAGLTQGSAQISVVNDGTHNVLVGAMWNSGVWRYIEP
jgi:hypothetical protein